MQRKVRVILPLCLSFILGIVCTIGFANWRYKSGDYEFPITKLETFRGYQETMNAPAHPISELADSIINYGSKESYYEMNVYCLDIGSYKLLPWSLLMANKYDYDEAYLDVYFSLYDLNSLGENKKVSDWSLDNLDKKTREMAIEYIEIAAKKGQKQAKEILTFYEKEGKYINK